MPELASNVPTEFSRSCSQACRSYIKPAITEHEAVQLCRNAKALLALHCLCEHAGSGIKFPPVSCVQLIIHTTLPLSMTKLELGQYQSTQHAMEAAEHPCVDQNRQQGF